MNSPRIDIYSPDVYADRVPHELFARLRRESPVYWHEEPDGPGFWSITKHADVREVARDALTYSSEMGGVQIPDLPKGDMRVSPDNLAVMDPPRHSSFRALVASAFTPAGLAKMESYVEARTNALVDQLAKKESFDFMVDFAEKLPTGVILEMVGVPSSDERQLKRWVAQLLTPDDPEFCTSPEGREATMKAFMVYAHALAAERRAEPRDDLLSRLMAAEVDGKSLSYEEFGMFFMLLLAAGTHSTQLALGSGVQLLLENPEQMRRLREDPALAVSAAEEVLRHSPPIIHFRRTAKRDTAIRGQKIAEGQKVVMWFVSANRDEEVFEKADAFDIARTPNDHVTFGHGPHHCLGNALARLELRTSFATIAKRLPGLELAAKPQRVRSNWFNGMKSLPLRNPGRS